MSIETRIYAIYDVKSGMYGPAMTFANDGTAIRSFQEMLISKDPNSLLSLYPSDYILFCLGLYNQETGLLESCPAPMNILSGSEAFLRACNEASERRKRAAALEGRKFDDIDYGFTPLGLEQAYKTAQNITSDTIDKVSVSSDDVCNSDN